ncbi:MAG TPA: hypothetical protein PKH10_04010 [bacterium]|nr:hypothetical protein [bacterium]
MTKQKPVLCLLLFLVVSVCFSFSCSHDNENPSASSKQRKIPDSTATPQTDTQEQDKNIPKTLDEAHALLEKQLPKEELAKIDAMKSEEEMNGFHFGLGMGLRNGWDLWNGSPLSKHMNDLGFFHPDDMSGVILDTFWCKRHKKDFRLKERAEYYKTWWLAVAKPPSTSMDPQDQSEIDWLMSLNIGNEKRPQIIHAGKSKKSKRWLVYEYDKGVYVPNKELLEKIKKQEEYSR